MWRIVFGIIISTFLLKGSNDGTRFPLLKSVSRAVVFGRGINNLPHELCRAGLMKSICVPRETCSQLSSSHLDIFTACGIHFIFNFLFSSNETMTWSTRISVRRIMEFSLVEDVNCSLLIDGGHIDWRSLRWR